MKYVKSIFAVVLWMLVCCTGMDACAEVMYGAFPLACEAGEARTVDVELAGSLNAICIDGERGFLLSDRELWAVDDELNRLKKLHVFDEALCGMDVRDNVVYFSYLVDGVTRFARLTDDGAVEDLFDVQTERTMFRMLVAQEKVFVLWEYSAYELLSLKEGRDTCKVAIYSLDGEEQQTPIADAYDMAFSDVSGVLFLPDSGGSEAIIAMDPRNGAWRPLEIYSGGENIAAAPETGEIYIRNINGIFCHAQEGQPPEECWAEWEENWADTALVCTKKQLISYRQHGDMDVHTWDLIQATDEPFRENQLTVVNANAEEQAMRRALELFGERHPEVEVIFRQMTEEQLNTALMANDGSVDVLALYSGDAMRYVAAGVIADIDADAVLRQQQEALVGSNAFCWDGVRYGVGSELYVTCLKRNEALEAYAPPLDWENCSWAELLSAAEEFAAAGNGGRGLYFLMDSCRFPAWYAQYRALYDDPKQIVFDTETFRTLAEQYKACVQAGVILDSGAEGADPARAVCAVEKLYTLSGAAFDPLPGLGMERPVPADAFALAICRGTRHGEWAKELLRCLGTEESQRQMNAIGLSGESEIYPAYGDLTEAEQRNLEAQKAYFNQARPEWYHLEFNQYAGDLFEKYFADEISLDGLVNGLQLKLRMVLWG